MDGGERVVPSCFAIQVAIAAVEFPLLLSQLCYILKISLSCPTENDLVAPSKVEWFILLNYLIQQFDKAYCTAHILAYPNE